MDHDEFRRRGHELVDWVSDYLQNIEKYPVKSQVKPGEVFSKLPDKPPLEPEPFDNLMDDVENIILPGITHWQSPNFFAYFPANTSPPSILAELITSAIGAQCMIWETSPAAAELEEKVMNWLRDLIGLPSDFEGVIQDTASTATLAALITAREKSSGFSINRKGFSDSLRLRVYCSEQTHSSIEKAVKISGIGRENLVRIKTKKDWSLDTKALEVAIREDISAGFTPCAVMATIGTTGTTAIDPIKPIGEVCSKYNIWLHVDAALAGTALILPEYSWMIDGREYIDSFVFNPHKWMFTNFDCTVYFVKDANLLIRTFEILPEYLKTRTRGEVNDYRDWGVPLGRRFRALKLWFVIRSYGIEGLRRKIRDHISFASHLAGNIENHPDFEIMAPTPLNTVTFRFNPGKTDEVKLNKLNEMLNYRLNDSGKLYLTHTKLGNDYVLRMVTSQTNVTMEHVNKAWKLIIAEAGKLIREKD